MTFRFDPSAIQYPHHQCPPFDNDVADAHWPEAAYSEGAYIQCGGCDWNSESDHGWWEHIWLAGAVKP